jgi:hypothetical protein
MEVNGQLYVPATLLLGKNSHYSLYRSLDGPWSWCGCCGEEIDLASAENQTPAVQPIALSIPIELSQLPPSFVCLRNWKKITHFDTVIIFHHHFRLY